MQRARIVIAPENAVTLAGLSVTPDRVVGGTAASGRVTLTAPAPLGGALVAIAAKRRNIVSVPQTVMVPEGATSAVFPIGTEVVHGQKERALELVATYNDTTATATLTVTPPPTTATSSQQRPAALCASLALAPCLTRTALQIATSTSTAFDRQYNLYTPELSLLAETLASSNTAPPIAYEYIWFAGEPLAQVNVAANQVHYYFNDHLGTPLLQTDATARIVWQVEYEPYGTVYAARRGEARHPLRFPGQEAGGSGELSYNVYRWYRSGWGRYTQGDPLGKFGDPNPYAYTLGNPITNADPRGLKVFKCCRDIQVNAIINGVSQMFGYKHCFIKTDSVEAGLGPADNGPLPACPLGVPTAVTNHAGQSQQSGTTCTEIKGVDEQCVNNALPVGQKMGVWTPANNCNNFADNIFKKCTPCGPKNEPFPTPFGPCAKLADGSTVCAGTAI